MENSNKKQRVSDETDWVIVMEDASPLRMILDVIGNVKDKDKLTIQILKTGKDYFLKCISMGMGGSSWMCGRLLLDNVTLSDEERAANHLKKERPDIEGLLVEFIMNPKFLSSTIDLPSCSHLTLTLQSYQDGGMKGMKVCLHDPEEHSHEVVSKLSFMSDTPDESLVPIEFKMTVDFDLYVLKEMIKIAKSAQAEKLNIKIYTKNKGPVKLSMVTFHVKNKATFEHTQRICHEATTDEDGSLIVRAGKDGAINVVDFDDIEPEFDQSFEIKHIDEFIKPLPCRMLTGKVGPDSPLVLHHPIGGSGDVDMSYLRLVLMPSLQDD